MPTCSTLTAVCIQATYYGDFKGAGACSFQFSTPNSFTLPWAYGDKFGVAMNSPQWAGSAVCGMCIAFTGAGTGAGNPIYKPSQTNQQYTIGKVYYLADVSTQLYRSTRHCICLPACQSWMIQSCSWKKTSSQGDVLSSR